ncbi:hypothetical protein AMR72_05935 [Flavobacterium psychrophilum]|nr:hypothetical protein AMR72_05935 [Flavobacterium psychrophilum]AOE52098.1 hypothetical protein ALW18_05930 [Flavobacterium psychrophilum]
MFNENENAPEWERDPSDNTIHRGGRFFECSVFSDQYVVFDDSCSVAAGARVTLVPLLIITCKSVTLALA